MDVVTRDTTSLVWETGETGVALSIDRAVRAEDRAHRKLVEDHQYHRGAPGDLNIRRPGVIGRDGTVATKKSSEDREHERRPKGTSGRA